MTRLLFFVLIPLFASAQIIDFPDSNFKNALLNTPCALVEGSDEFMDADIDNDGEIDMDEAASIWQLNVLSAVAANRPLSDAAVGLPLPSLTQGEVETVEKS